MDKIVQIMIVRVDDSMLYYGLTESGSVWLKSITVNRHGTIESDWSLSKHYKELEKIVGTRK